mgnify:CR=1 FL=1
MIMEREAFFTGYCRQTDGARTVCVEAEDGELNASDYAVVELSSFQLMDMEHSSHVAVVTNVSPNHLNWHVDYEEYSVMLINGIIAYERRGDSGSANILKKELQSLKQEMEGLNNHVSKLGSMIIDQPVTQLPDEVLNYINLFNREDGDSH